ncbi:minichromosome maintenance domain-containing protein 2-like [Lingula anatina]|uniref:Minichromosome maintenance domain-containing protein 2-like n=1 Tax=Lingula anatina TaxID=7574 RepID=A0A1S3I3Y5_LINAN|nr:minichromosome maintenance domain-containing protein 2-like [Lingula anatina]|eukprot:XP_013392546.1 minichromosome maintenance domain-containing protein 2-like [Lingula anatina]
MDQKLLEYRIAALEYLDQTGTLEDIKRTCRTLGAQTEKKHAVFRFCIPVEPEDVLDLNASFGNFILNKPSGACKIFQSVIFRAIQVLQLLPQCSDASQVMVVLRPLSLPRLEKYFISSTKDFPNHSEGQRLYMYEGIVTGKTIATKYTQSARFYCPIEGCDGGQGNRYIRLHSSGAREIHTIRKDFKCSFCGSPLEEDVSERVLADKVIIEMMDEQAFQYSQYISDMVRSTRFQALTFYTRDELSQDIQIGKKYTVIGIPTYEFQENNQVNVALEASNINVAQVHV